MAYIPKSQIKANQFTPGAEWYYVKNNASYTGFYYVLSNGKAYTGKDPNNPPNDEIYKKINKVYICEQGNLVKNIGLCQISDTPTPLIFWVAAATHPPAQVW